MPAFLNFVKQFSIVRLNNSMLFSLKFSGILHSKCVLWTIFGFLWRKKCEKPNISVVSKNRENLLYNVFDQLLLAWQREIRWVSALNKTTMPNVKMNGQGRLKISGDSHPPPPLPPPPPPPSCLFMFSQKACQFEG